MEKRFMDKANRDAEFNRLGGSKAGYRKTSRRNQIMHPEYISDYTQVTGKSFETGFGNTDYRTFFSVVYSIEKDDRNRNPYRY